MQERIKLNDEDVTFIRRLLFEAEEALEVLSEKVF